MPAFALRYWAGKGAASSPRGREKFNWRIWRKSCWVNCVCSSCKSSVLQHPVVSPLGSVFVRVSVCVPVCRRLWGEGAGYKIKVLSSQVLRTVKRNKTMCSIFMEISAHVVCVAVQQDFNWWPGSKHNHFIHMHTVTERVLLECVITNPLIYNKSATIRSYNKYKNRNSTLISRFQLFPHSYPWLCLALYVSFSSGVGQCDKLSKRPLFKSSTVQRRWFILTNVWAFYSCVWGSWSEYIHWDIGRFNSCA